MYTHMYACRCIKYIYIYRHTYSCIHISLSLSLSPDDVNLAYPCFPASFRHTSGMRSGGAGAKSVLVESKLYYKRGILECLDQRREHVCLGAFRICCGSRMKGSLSIRIPTFKSGLTPKETHFKFLDMRTGLERMDRRSCGRLGMGTGTAVQTSSDPSKSFDFVELFPPISSCPYLYGLAVLRR